MIVSIFTFSIGAADDITVVLDGETVEFDVAPQIINGRTMVPIRAVFEALGATLDWNATTRTATATIDDYVVKCTIDSKILTVCGESVAMDTAPVIIGGRTLMPLRFAAEAFGCNVGWAAPINTAYIISPGYTSDTVSNGDQ
ncbi:MAG: copper amine oxidase N-terminal domain-containing protein [Clostridia bacterium]|nr:copper amine oxidase N-terminal domain-containing protein [Clostridia bacterium]